MLHRIDRGINNIENFLSTAAVVPLVGCVPGGLKGAMGILQTISAVAIAALVGIPMGMAGRWSLFRYSCTHILHGVTNIIAGALEGVPGLGSLGYLVRKKNSAPKYRVWVFTGHENKIIPYKSLEERDWKIDGRDKTLVEEVKAEYSNRVQAAAGELSRREKMKIAIIVCTKKPLF